ncbi:carotenoid oxygenase family protein [Amycolatopsis sp. WQ 127309]|uniref:carotenoid oxygenase family protein n=1 Tax=Amycolatopsis sp. WQ 127309 TaxID=2932773 RepID=UPI001FF67133|nr:carotenoid oxygenase family protein [Amycolatopsis sp. WQ 127309]UOZ07016.1 carotenoid oxygenase family protein [Amycolatopsis sp. WQ 127309]
MKGLSVSKVMTLPEAVERFVRPGMFLHLAVAATPVMHDMALTPNHVILFDNPARATGSLSPATGRVCTWKWNRPTRLGVLRRGAAGFGRPLVRDRSLLPPAQRQRPRVRNGIRDEGLPDQTLGDRSRPRDTSGGGRSTSRVGPSGTSS